MKRSYLFLSVLFGFIVISASSIAGPGIHPLPPPVPKHLPVHTVHPSNTTKPLPIPVPPYFGNKNPLFQENERLKRGLPVERIYDKQGLRPHEYENFNSIKKDLTSDYFRENLFRALREIRSDSFLERKSDGYQILRDYWKPGYIRHPEKGEIELKSYGGNPASDFWEFAGPATSLSGEVDGKIFSEVGPQLKSDIKTDSAMLALLSSWQAALKDEKSQISEKIGSLGRNNTLPQDYPGAVPLFEGHGSGQFDAIYWCCKKIDESSKEYNFIIVPEDKGGSGRVGTKKIEGFDVQQGHPAYVQAIAKLGLKKIENGKIVNKSYNDIPIADTIALFERIARDVEIGQIEIILYKTSIPDPATQSYTVKRRIFSSFPGQGYFRSLHEGMASKIWGGEKTLTSQVQEDGANYDAPQYHDSSFNKPSFPEERLEEQNASSTTLQHRRLADGVNNPQGLRQGYLRSQSCYNNMTAMQSLGRSIPVSFPMKISPMR